MLLCFLKISYRAKTALEKGWIARQVSGGGILALSLKRYFTNDELPDQRNLKKITTDSCLLSPVIAADSIIF